MIHNVLPLIQTLIDILRLRKGPDAIPYSQVLLVLLFAVWAATHLIADLLLEQDFAFADTLARMLISLLGLAVYGLIIVINGKKPRLQQSFSALVGCGVLLTVPLVLLSLGVPTEAREAGAMVFLIILAFWALIFWGVVVDAHIIAKTVERPLLYGFLVAASVLMLQLTLVSGLNNAASGA